MNPASHVDSILSVYPSTESESFGSSNVMKYIPQHNQVALISPVCVKRRHRDDDVILQNAKPLRPPIKGSTSVRSVNFPAVRGFSITEEDSITNDAPIPTYPTFYEICKQCWTMYEPCKEYQYYDCIEGECGEHGTQ